MKILKGFLKKQGEVGAEDFLPDWGILILVQTLAYIRWGQVKHRKRAPLETKQSSISEKN